MAKHSELFKLMKNRNEMNGEFTHVLIGEGSGYLSSDKSQDFFKKYNEMLKEGYKVSVAEAPGNFVPLLIDIDIKKEISRTGEMSRETFRETSREMYNEDDVKTVIKAFQTTISENVDRRKPVLKNKNLWCILLEKDMKIEKIDETKEIIKKGIHLHFPHLFLSKEDVKMLISKAKDTIDEARPFKNVEQKPSSLIDDVSTKCWLMYGSSKKGNNRPYKISQVFDHNLNPISTFKCFQNEKCLDDSCITETNIESELVMLMSINPRPSVISNKIFSLKEEVKLKEFYSRHPSPGLNSETGDVWNEHVMSEKEIDKMKKLVSFLSPSRADDYNQWWSVGITLFNIGKSGNCEDEALEAWKAFSEQSNKYDESECDLKWMEMSKRNTPVNMKTMGSLIYMAKADNPKLLEQYLNSEQIFGSQGLNGNWFKTLKIPSTDTEIAEMFVDRHEGKYLNGNIGWYKFNGIIWGNLEVVGRSIRKSLVEISRNYKKIIPSLNSVTNDDDRYCEMDEEDENLTKLAKTKIKEINKLSAKCENNGSQISIIKVIEDMVGVDELNEKMNQNKHLIAFKNGVFDLSLFIFRQGLPEDFISKQMNIHYDTTLFLEHPKVVKMLNFFKKIIPDPELFEYFMLENCEMFLGGNRDKVLQIWTGSGNNGKTAVNRIIENNFGKLAIKLPKGMVTGDVPKAGACFPELTRAQGGVRWAVVDEFAPDETVNAGIIKNLTGQDRLYARDIHQKGRDVVDFEPFFKLIFICNTIPNIRNPDNATWERIRVIPFESTFKDSIDGIAEETRIKDKIFLKDTSFCEKEIVQELGEALTWYLIQKFVQKEKSRLEARKEGKNFKIHIPFKVREATELYKAQGNAIADYCNEKFDKSENESDIIDTRLYYQDFVQWFTETHSNKNVNMDKKKFLKLFIEHNKGDMSTFMCRFLKRKDSGEEWGFGEMKLE